MPPIKKKEKDEESDTLKRSKEKKKEEKKNTGAAGGPKGRMDKSGSREEKRPPWPPAAPAAPAAPSHPLAHPFRPFPSPSAPPAALEGPDPSRHKLPPRGEWKERFREDLKEERGHESQLEEPVAKRMRTESDPEPEPSFPANAPIPLPLPDPKKPLSSALRKKDTPKKSVSWASDEQLEQIRYFVSEEYHEVPSHCFLFHFISSLIGFFFFFFEKQQNETKTAELGKTFFPFSLANTGLFAPKKPLLKFGNLFRPRDLRSSGKWSEGTPRRNYRKWNSTQKLNGNHPQVLFPSFL